MAAPEPRIMDVQPAEAVEFFRAKGMHIAHDWRDTSAAWHARSFTVAKVAKLDILADIRDAADKALAEGWSYDTFQKELEPILRRKGWWGRRTVTDPLTGETRKVQLGSPRRLRIIYDTNINMAVAAGEWRKIERLAHLRPYIRYIGVLDSRIRPQHAAWHGTVLHWDHPFWQTHFPPNGWLCRCAVQSLSESDLKRFGHRVTEPPAGWQDARPWHNRRTGTVVQVPRGIDPGFAHNAGTADPVDGARALLRERLEAAPPVLAPAVNDDPGIWIAEGRKIRKTLVADAGGNPDDPGFADRLRGLVAQGLTTARGAGTEEAGAGPARNRLWFTPNKHLHRAAVEAVNAASLRFPASWVVKGRSVPLKAAGNGFDGGGVYYPKARSGKVKVGGDMVRKRAGEAWAVVSYDPGNAVHEYVHHLQHTLAGIDRLFQTLHRRRTTEPDGTREPILPLTGYLKSKGRKDRYVDGYFGREYGPEHSAFEVMTRAFQILFHKLPGDEGADLQDLVRDDPEMLDLVLGLLFHYDPP